jgi:hypothetical protein
MQSPVMLFALLYAVLRRVIGSGRPSADRELEIEVVVLRHQGARDPECVPSMSGSSPRRGPSLARTRVAAGGLIEFQLRSGRSWALADYL